MRGRSSLWKVLTKTNDEKSGKGDKGEPKLNGWSRSLGCLQTGPKGVNFGQRKRKRLGMY